MKSRILFMGTPDFARSSLEALIAAGADIIGVLTQPDKPRGRKMELIPSPVKACALEHNIPVYQPNTLRDNAFAELLETLAPELIIVAAYGKILPENVLSYPRLGCINVHGSLLPKYRGAAPIQRAIIDGERETGVTIMYMAEGIDTGDMLAKVSCAIYPDDNFETLHDRLADLGAKLLCEVVEKLEDGSAVREKQDDLKSTYAAKITNDDCIVDFNDTAENIHNRIRGLSPFPLAVAEHDGRAVKLIASELYESETEHRNPGEVLRCDGAGNRIIIACKKGAIALTALLPEGKKRMTAADYINGRRVAIGDMFKKYTNI